MKRFIWPIAWPIMAFPTTFLPATAAGAGDKPAAAVRFSESFDDSRLLQRGWYDGGKFTINDTHPYAGKGCLEYAWKDGGTVPANSSGMRRLFEPTDTVA